MAIAVIKADDIVDDYFIKIRKDLVDLVKKDINNLEQAFDLMMIAKYLERIGDHATNIAEWVVFSLTGRRYFDPNDPLPV
jgi:phosphate transport system protein